MIRLSEPAIGVDELAAAKRVLESGRLVMGAEVAAFEEELAGFLDAPHVVATSSGTAALHAVLGSMGVGHGRRVVVPAFSWVATANAVAVLGGEPLFVDVGVGDWCLSPEALQAAMDQSSVDVVMPVHAFGYVADMTKISEIAEIASVPVIEDAACALGSIYNGVPAGRLGLAGCFSFHPRKVITTGEGGAVTTADGALAEEVRRFVNHGQSTIGGDRFPRVGLNYRMTEVAGAIGRVQLARLPEMLAQRRRLAKRYRTALAGSDVRCQTDEELRTTYQTFVVELPPTIDREVVISELRSFDIEASVGTISIPTTSAYIDRHGDHEFPNTARADRSLMSLPLHGKLSESEVDEVSGRLADIVQRLKSKVPS
jgi:perosamine synthetase